MTTDREAIDASRELADFLRTRRERLTPEDVGLPPRRAARTPGLRREDVAALAHVSSDYVSRLEQARGLKPSAEVIDALARALRLSDDETAYVYRLSGHAFTPRRTADETVDSLRALVTALSPLPAMLVDARFDIVAWNPEMSALMVDFASIPQAERNTVWLCVLHPALSDFYRDREKILREGIADLRAAWAARPDDPALTGLVQTLRSHSQEFSDLWQQRDVVVLAQGLKRLRHADYGDVDVRYDTLTPLGDHAWRIYVYRAADQRSQTVLDAIAAGVAP